MYVWQTYFLLNCFENKRSKRDHIVFDVYLGDSTTIFISNKGTFLIFYRGRGLISISLPYFPAYCPQALRFFYIRLCLMRAIYQCAISVKTLTKFEIICGQYVVNYFTNKENCSRNPLTMPKYFHMGYIFLTLKAYFQTNYMILIS